MWSKKKSAADRRRAPRKSVQWEASWAVLGEAPTWSGSPCTIQEVSAQGAHLLLERGTAVREGQTLLLTIEEIGGTPVGLGVRGVVRNVRPQMADGSSVGVEIAFDASNARIAKTLFAG